MYGRVNTKKRRWTQNPTLLRTVIVLLAFAWITFAIYTVTSLLTYSIEVWNLIPFSRPPPF
jgi:hypothetical protein